MAGFIARAPCRVDLLGGTLDITPLPALLGGATTLNAAIGIHAEARVAPSTQWVLEAKDIDAVFRCDALTDLPDPGETRLLGTATWHVAADFEAAAAHDHDAEEPPAAPACHVTTRSAAPPKSGLGGSSAMAIAMLGALYRFYDLERSPEELPHIAGDIESHVLQAPTGLQDYYPAVFGGVAALEFGFGGLGRVELEPEPSAEFGAHLVVAYTGLSHASGELNWSVLRAVVDGDPTVRGHIDQIHEVALEGSLQLLSADWAALGQSLDADWDARRQLAPGISTPDCERMLGAARAAGALGARLCGAGGGGCLVALAPPAKRADVEQALTKAGAEILPCGLDVDGLVVEPLPDGE